VTVEEYRGAVGRRMLRREIYRHPRTPGSSIGHFVIVDWSKRTRGPGAMAAGAARQSFAASPRLPDP